MRELTFVVEPGIGPGEFPRRGSLADLVLALPYVVMDEIPPRRVLNDVLGQGVLDAGMSGGCLWEPFEIGPAEYEEVVRELQRRGRRRHTGRDRRPFAIPATPDSVRTYSDWVAFRYEQKVGSRLPPSRDPEEAPVPSSYDRWLDRLPVADLYLGYLDAMDREWRARDDDAFDLPAELVSALRALAVLRDEWLTRNAALRGPELQQWLREHAKRSEQVRDDARACVDRLGLPRWPY